ncbi:MAG: type II toxin-antitoxin system PemK/MazF family toxin [Clostridia bacterium]|nr:type II toxin-antitoxin system PemK/MazF family toxin [Clostridia bacterium]
MKENWCYKRGDLYYANLNPYQGSEQGGTRPVIVLQNNVGNIYCPTLIVAPLTSKIAEKKKLPTHYLVEDIPKLATSSLVLLEQIKTIDKSRIISYIGKVSGEQMRGIEDAMQISLGIYIPAEVEAP